MVRYLQGSPRAAIEFGARGEDGMARMWTDSDWAGDTDAWRLCSGGWIELEGNLMAHWSKLQPNVALSSRDMELNAVVRRISEGSGLVEHTRRCTAPCQTWRFA